MAVRHMIKKAFGALMLAAIVVSSLSGAVRGDGMPIAEYQVSRTLRENRQLALVDVHGNGTESLSLYISVASLEPGKNITILLPMLTPPASVGLKRTDDWVFEDEHSLAKAFTMANAAEDGAQRLGESYQKTLSDAALENLLPFGLVLTQGYASAGGLGGGAAHVFVDEGLSADVVSFKNVSSLKDAFDGLGVAVPENARGIVEAYGNYNAVMVSATTVPPIDSQNYSSLQRSYPSVLSQFKEFVAAHPSIELNYWGSGPASPDFAGYGGWFVDPALERLYESVSYQPLKDIFYGLVLATYGIGALQGFELSAELPLDNGSAFFPLGTSPAWSGQGSVRVAFEVPEGKKMSFPVGTRSIVMDGKRLYLFDYGTTAPDFDLRAAPGKAGMSERIGDAWLGFGIWLHDNSEPLGTALAALTFWLIWFAIAFIALRWARLSARRHLVMAAGVSTLSFAMAFVLTVIGGLALMLLVFLVVYSDKNNMPTRTS
ncbi:MAG: hypothetical protein HZB92_06960 [Euryarchaeota archaeon]|nr:hypothetical protein [Euryarchaeota archaeon]